MAADRPYGEFYDFTASVRNVLNTPTYITDVTEGYTASTFSFVKDYTATGSSETSATHRNLAISRTPDDCSLYRKISGCKFATEGHTGKADPDDDRRCTFATFLISLCSYVCGSSKEWAKNYDIMCELHVAVVVHLIRLLPFATRNVKYGCKQAIFCESNL
jgi:hypothetical protein